MPVVLKVLNNFIAHNPKRIMGQEDVKTIKIILFTFNFKQYQLN